MESGAFGELDPAAIETMVQWAELLGPDIHIRSDYGDEAGGLTPWELFGAADAHEALTWAKDAVTLAGLLVHSELAKDAEDTSGD